MEEAKRKESTIALGAASLLLTFTFFIFGPIEGYMSNVGEFWFTLGSMMGGCLLTGLLAGLILFGAGCLLPKRWRPAIAGVFFGLGLALYIQGNFIMTDYGVLDGKQIDWSAYTSTAIWDTVFWLAILALPFILKKLIPQKYGKIIIFASAFVVLMQLVSLIGLGLMTDLSKKNSYLSDEGLYSAGGEEQAVVFILDTFDQKYLDEILEEDPDFLEPLDGFTCFENTTCAYPTTKASLPFILTGQYYENERPYTEYIQKAYKNTSYYRELQDAGYEIGIYTLGPFVSDAAKEEYCVNGVLEGLAPSSYVGLEKSLLRFTAFSYFPHVAKRFVWFYSGIFDELQSTESSSEVSSEVYSGLEDNMKFYTPLKENGLTVVPDGKLYRLIHLQGAHPPFDLNEDLTTPEDGEGTAVGKAKGALRIVFEYLSQLREAGLYDHSLIIITADHGVYSNKGQPILFAKRIGDKGELKTSRAPVSHADLQATILSELGVDGAEAYGESVFDVTEDDARTRRYLYYNWKDDWEQAYMPEMTEFLVDPDGNELNNFHETGKRYSSENTVETYRLGESLDFTSGGNAGAYLRDGFAWSEKKGTWAGAESSLRFVFEEQPEKDLMVTIETVWGSGYMTVYFNDYCAYSQWTDAPGEVSFLVPLEAVADGTQEIRYELTANMPMASNAESKDTRYISIMFSTMTIEETDEEAPAEEIRPGNEYTLGDEIVFTEDNDGRRYFLYGVSALENDFVWSLGEKSQIVLCTGENGKNGDITAHIEFENIFNGQQRVRVFAGGQAVFDGQVTKADPVMEFSIPGELWNDRVVLELSYPDADRPSNQGSDDERVLAVAFKSMVFTAQEG